MSLSQKLSGPKTVAERKNENVRREEASKDVRRADIRTVVALAEIQRVKTERTDRLVSLELNNKIKGWGAAGCLSFGVKLLGLCVDLACKNRSQ